MASLRWACVTNQSFFSSKAEGTSGKVEVAKFVHQALLIFRVSFLPINIPVTTTDIVHIQAHH
jgi:hypothetical protein